MVHSADPNFHHVLLKYLIGYLQKPIFKPYHLKHRLILRNLSSNDV